MREKIKTQKFERGQAKPVPVKNIWEGRVPKKSDSEDLKRIGYSSCKDNIY